VEQHCTLIFHGESTGNEPKPPHTQSASQDPCPTSVILDSDELGGRQGNNQAIHGLTSSFAIESCGCPGILKPTDLKGMGNRCDEP